MRILRKNKTQKVQPNNVEQLFESFWKKKVCKRNGNLDVEAVKNELHDYKMILDEVTKVYDFITHGKLGRIDLDSEIIIGFYKKDIQEQIVEGVKNYRSALQISDIEFVQTANRVLNELMENNPELSAKTATKLLQIIKDNGFLILKS